MASSLSLGVNESKPKSAFENAVQSWAQIDLSSIQRKLDDQGMDLRGEQKVLLANRRDLAKRTKEFKRLEDTQKLLEINSLLKSYQNEIDTLATKQKKAELYFFGFYRVIAEAPDPAPLLQLSLKTAHEQLEYSNQVEEITKLKDELAKKADYDLLKQRLQNMEETTAETISSNLKQQEDMYKALIDEKESNWKNIETQHNNQLAALKAAIEELKTTNEVAELQLHSHNQQISQSTHSGSSVELDLLRRDVETWKKRVFELEKRNESLRAELTTSKIDSTESKIRNTYEQRLANLESENVLLLANLRQTREKLDLAERESTTKLGLISKQLDQKLEEINHLKENLLKMEDYEEIKQELHLMRQMEFGEDEEGDSKNLDSLLVNRNKSLTNELAEYRSQHSELLSKVESLNRELDITVSDLKKAHALNTKLESDLSDIQDLTKSNFNDSASVTSQKSLGIHQTPRHMSINQGFNSEDISILPIITQQRDRFRDKNKVLEDDLKKQQAVIKDLKTKNIQLQSDNENLYEKTRYMASLQKSQSQLGVNLLTPKRNGSIALTLKAQLQNFENPYLSSYESKLHPIEQFRQKEQERINSRLSPLERLFIFVTRSVLATRTTRMLFLMYCMFLHLIVMFTTIHAMNLSARMIPEVGLSHSTGGTTNEKIVNESPF